MGSMGLEQRDWQPTMHNHGYSVNRQKSVPWRKQLAAQTDLHKGSVLHEALYSPPCLLFLGTQDMTFPCLLTVRLGPKDWVLANRTLADAVRVLVQGTGESMCLFSLLSAFCWRPWSPCVPDGRETRWGRTIDPHQTWWNQEIKLLLLSYWDKDFFVTTEPSLFWLVQWKCLG